MPDLKGMVVEYLKVKQRSTMEGMLSTGEGASSVVSVSRRHVVANCTLIGLRAFLFFHFHKT